MQSRYNDPLQKEMAWFAKEFGRYWLWWGGTLLCGFACLVTDWGYRRHFKTEESVISGWIILAVALSGVLVAAFCVARDARKSAWEDRVELEADIKERDGEVHSLQSYIEDLRRQLRDRTALEKAEQARTDAVNSQVEKDEAWRTEERERQQKRDEETRALQASESLCKAREARIEGVVKEYLKRYDPQTNLGDNHARIAVFIKAGAANLETNEEIRETCDRIRRRHGKVPDLDRETPDPKQYLSVFADWGREVTDAMSYLDFLCKNHSLLPLHPSPNIEPLLGCVENPPLN